jgi:hypothetical protein
VYKPHNAMTVRVMMMFYVRELLARALPISTDHHRYISVKEYPSLRHVNTMNYGLKTSAAIY